MNYKFLILLFLFSLINSNNKNFKIIQFDYSNIPSDKRDFISIFESIDFYLGLLFKKNEMKDYNHYNKMYRDITQKKLACGIYKITIAKKIFRFCQKSRKKFPFLDLFQKLLTYFCSHCF